MNYHVSKNAHIYIWGYLNQILTSSEIRDPLFKPLWFMWSHMIFSHVHVHTGIQPYRENPIIPCVMPSAYRHASVEGDTVTSGMLVWSLEKPLVGYISSPFWLWLSYPQSDASMAPIQYCAQAQVHRVKLCSKVSGIARPQNRSLSAAVRILVCVTAPEIMCQKKKMRLYICDFLPLCMQVFMQEVVSGLIKCHPVY